MDRHDFEPRYRALEFPNGSIFLQQVVRTRWLITPRQRSEAHENRRYGRRYRHMRRRMLAPQE